jgi:hypothetical protein
MVMDSNHRRPCKILIYSQAPSVALPTIHKQNYKIKKYRIKSTKQHKNKISKQKSPETFRCNPGFPSRWVVIKRFYIENRSRIACLALSSNRE